jgi:hypothetical protein
MEDQTNSRLLSGIGALRGPIPGTQFREVVKLVVKSLSRFADSILEDNIDTEKKIENENGMNRKLARFISNVGGNMDLPYIAQPESMEDETLGNSPAVDIGIYLKVNDIARDPPKVTVFEGKRLSSNKLEAKRRREYVCGHEENGKHVFCGGIERFKRSIHGRDIKSKCAGMIGYMQDETFDIWFERVNSWICDLTKQEHDPGWVKEETLALLSKEHRIMESYSTVYRHADKLHLTHLWINLLP